jgi:hypothetical protein
VHTDRHRRGSPPVRDGVDRDARHLMAALAHAWERSPAPSRSCARTRSATRDPRAQRPPVPTPTPTMRQRWTPAPARLQTCQRNVCIDRRFTDASVFCLHVSYVCKSSLCACTHVWTSHPDAHMELVCAGLSASVRVASRRCAVMSVGCPPTSACLLIGVIQHRMQRRYDIWSGGAQQRGRHGCSMPAVQGAQRSSGHHQPVKYDMRGYMAPARLLR